MKLNIVPASRGIQWVKLGVQTFFRQPLALSGLFFIFLAVMTLLSVVPLVGGLVAFVLMPGASMGLMAAAREAHAGKFPMPMILATAFRSGAPQRRHMLVLGGLNTAGIVIMLLLSPLFDGGSFAKLMLLGQVPPVEVIQTMDFQLAMLFVMALNLPLTLLFYHASALVHWHNHPPVKSLFFGIAAIAGNFRAFAVYGLVWIGIFFGFAIILATLALSLGGVEAVAAIGYPATMLIAIMVAVSVYFTFQDCFEFTPGEST